MVSNDHASIFGQENVARLFIDFHELSVVYSTWVHSNVIAQPKVSLPLHFRGTCSLFRGRKRQLIGQFWLTFEPVPNYES